MRIADLVKTYRLINDPQAPPWSVKFLSSLFIAAVIAAGVGTTLFVMNKDIESNEMTTFSRTTQEGTQVDYVGYNPDTFSPRLAYDKGIINGAMEGWMRRHPGATIVDEEPVTVGGFLVGYYIHYVP